jgi:hypothetical protein
MAQTAAISSASLLERVQTLRAKRPQINPVALPSSGDRAPAASEDRNQSILAFGDWTNWDQWSDFGKSP